MAERSRRPVEEAEGHVRAVASTAPAVSDFVAQSRGQPTEASVAMQVSAAERSVRSLSGDWRREIETRFGEMPRGDTRGTMGGEARGPASVPISRVARSVEAGRRYLEERRVELEEAGGHVDRGRATRDAFAGFFGFGQSEEYRLQEDQAAASRLSGVVGRWLTEEYLTPAIHRAVSDTPPVVVVGGARFFNTEEEATERSAAGCYFIDSNVIALDGRDFRRRATTEADRLNWVAHETLHYAAYRGGGYAIRCTGEVPLALGRVQWLHEGLTELHAQQLTRSHGHDPSYVAYESETSVAFYMQRLAGPEALRHAYLTGDFTQVRAAVDRQLGAGAFEGLATRKNGTEALAFLTSRMDAHGVDYRSWSRGDEIMGRIQSGG